MNLWNDNPQVCADDDEMMSLPHLRSSPKLE
jgi:hypothetical protein